MTKFRPTVPEMIETLSPSEAVSESWPFIPRRTEPDDEAEEPVFDRASGGAGIVVRVGVVTVVVVMMMMMIDWIGRIKRDGEKKV